MIQSTTLAACHHANNCFLQPPLSSYKKCFLGSRIGGILLAMSSVMLVPEGLKWLENEHGVGGKNSPIHYIPEQVLCRMP